MGKKEKYSVEFPKTRMGKKEEYSVESKDMNGK
jgi:hypothetical protein